MMKPEDEIHSLQAPEAPHPSVPVQVSARLGRQPSSMPSRRRPRSVPLPVPKLHLNPTWLSTVSRSGHVLSGMAGAVLTSTRMEGETDKKQAETGRHGLLEWMGELDGELASVAA